MKFTLLLLLIFLISLSGFSQEKVITGYISKFDLIPTGNTKRVRLICIIPHSIEKIQKVLKIEYSMQPKRIFTENGNSYAEFIIESVEQTKKISINVDIEIYTHDFTTIKHDNNPKIESITSGKYLNEEKYIEKNDNLIRTLAPRLLASDTLRTVMNIYNFVQKNLTYDKKMTKSIGAVEAFKTKKGDCSEFSDLFVALCRANNIPSRVIIGIVATKAKSPRHAWAEVYLQKYGWIRLEPTSHYAQNFVMLKNKYIQLSTVRNDKTLSLSHFWIYSYWGDPIVITEKLKIK
jgi:hypothetical protein